MAIFTFSDIIISLTLFVNALALIATKLIQPSSARKHNDDINESQEQQEKESFHTRLCSFLVAVRRMSLIITVWNILFFILMIMIFNR